MDHSKVQHLLNIHQHYRDRLRDNSPDAIAAENTMGVFMHVLDRQQDALGCFQNILNIPGSRSINTLANALQVQPDQPQLREELDALLADNSAKGRLDKARTKCEQGYFTTCYIQEEIPNIPLVEEGIRLLQSGIREGKDYGMDAEEALVWKYYLFRATKAIHLDSILNVRRNTERKLAEILDAFLNFHEEATAEEREWLQFYKAHALVELADLFTRYRKLLRNPQEVLRYRSDVFQQLWQDPLAEGCQRALEVCPNDFEICYKVASAYIAQKQLNTAEEYVEKSLQLNRECNLQAEKRQLIIAGKRRDQECLEQAYKCGRATECKYHYVTGSFLLEMATICLKLTRFENCRESYLSEALAYGARTLTKMKYPGMQKKWNLLDKCLDMINDYTAEVEAKRHLVESDQPGNVINLVLYVILLPRDYQQIIRTDEQRKIAEEVAAALENGWEKHKNTGEDILNFIKRYTEWELVFGNRLIQWVLKSLDARNTENAKTVYIHLSRSIFENDLMFEYLETVDDVAAEAVARRQLAETDQPGNVVNLVFCVMLLSKDYQQRMRAAEQINIVAEIATALENGWQRHNNAGKCMLDFIKSYTEWELLFKSRLIHRVIENLGGRNTGNARSVYNYLSRSIFENGLMDKYLETAEDLAAEADDRRQLAETDQPGNVGNLVFCVMLLSKDYEHKTGADEQRNILADIAAALDNGWQRHNNAGESILKFLKLYTEWAAVSQKRLMQQVIMNLGRRNTENAMSVRDHLCRIIVEDPNQLRTVQVFCYQKLNARRQ